jgi:type I restriction enzyme, S subunit
VKTLIGDVPQDWACLTIGDICDATAGPSGSALKAEDLTDNEIGADSGVPVIAPRDLQDGFIQPASITHADYATARRLARYRLAPGDIIGVRTGTLARHALVEQEHTGWLFNTGCFRLRLKRDVPAAVHTPFLNYYLRHEQVRDWIHAKATRTTIPSLSMQNIVALPVVLPPLQTQLDVCQVLSALDEKILIHQQIAQTTRRLQRTLLPALLLGMGAGFAEG